MTDEKALDWMLTQNEGQYIEFKHGFSNAVGVAICAFDDALASLMAAGLLRYTIPEKPRSSIQRYLTTAAGKATLEEIHRGVAGGVSGGASGDARSEEG